MKNTYMTPKAELVILNSADIITSSLVAENDSNLVSNLLDELSI